MIIVGLTGSIAMGKTEVTKLLRARGIPVYDADAAVHKIYEQAETARLLHAEFPSATGENNVDRKELSRIITREPQKLKKLEAIIHPLVREEEQQFIATERQRGASIIVLDIPLLFETRDEKSFDAIVVVSAPEALQQERALARPGMTPEKLSTILARQLPDREKRKRASHILENNGSLEDLSQKVDALLTNLKSTKGLPS